MNETCARAIKYIVGHLGKSIGLRKKGCEYLFSSLVPKIGEFQLIQFLLTSVKSGVISRKIAH